MNILWIKDGKKGHEKQVNVLLEELSKTINISIYEENYHINSINKFFDIFHHVTFYIFKKDDKSDILRNYNKSDIRLIVGAGSNTHIRIASLKKIFKNSFNRSVIAISILTPSFFIKEFDIICAPEHDREKLKDFKNTLFFEGSLAKVSTQDPDDNIGLIGLGGTNKHYIFNENELLDQIEYVLSLYPNKQWHLFISRRTPETMIQKINKLRKLFTNIIIAQEGFDEIIKNASIKFITQDSINMVYESLSCKGKTILFNMDYKKENKVVKKVNELILNNQVGLIEKTKIVDSLYKTKIIMPNKFNEVFCEVEKLSYKLIKYLNLK